MRSTPASDPGPPVAAGDLDAEVLVVGAGAAGCLFAAELAKAGRRVVVLEAGPPWTAGDMVSSGLWARRLKWGGPPVLADQPTGHNTSFGWGFGGSALHHYGTWPRPTEETFKLRSRYGVGLDWPIDYDDLRPFYDRVQAEMGIAGDAAQEAAWRPPGAPYPMPPLQTFAQGEKLRAGFAKLGMPVGPLPALINTVWYKGRAPCLYDGWCDAGCPIGALGNPLAIHFPAAVKAGAVFRPHATVTRVESERGRVTGVVYADAAGAFHAARARTVVLAGSVMQNPRLLLASATPKAPRGLGNAAGVVGTYLTIEPSAHVFGLFEEDTEPYRGVSAGQLIHRKPHRGGASGAGAASARPDGAYQWQVAPAMKPNDIFGVAITRPELHGAALDGFIRTGAHRIASMAGFGADTPRRRNRVELDPTAKDAHGVALARVRHDISPAGRALFQHMADEGRAIMRAAGAKEAWVGPRAPGHITGGTIMGEDPATSVTDSFGRVHGIDGLMIAGAGLFPTNGGTSPTFTLTALALRQVEHLIAHGPG